MTTLASHRAQTQSELLMAPDVQAPDTVVFMLHVSLRKRSLGPNRKPAQRRLAGSPEPHALEFVFTFGIVLCRTIPPSLLAVCLWWIVCLCRLFVPCWIPLTCQLLPLHPSSPLVVSSFPMSTSSSVAVAPLVRLLSSSFVFCPRRFYSLDLSFSSWLRRLPLGYGFVSPLLRLSSSHRLFACLFDPASTALLANSLVVRLCFSLLRLSLSPVPFVTPICISYLSLFFS